MRTKYEFEVRLYSKDLPNGKPYKVLGAFNNLELVGKLRAEHQVNGCQVTHDDLEENQPFSYIHILEYRDDEHAYDQYWIDLDII